MKGAFIKKGRTFIPAGEEAEELLNAIKDGKECIIEIYLPRSLRQLRMFWALCQIVADNDPKVCTKDVAKRNILWALNYVTIWVDRSEKAHVETASIAFESMTQEEFNPFFQRAIDLISTWLNTAPAEIRKRVAEIVDPTKGYTIK